MPVQIKRLLIAFALFIGIMLVLKHYLTPDSWREYGPYRGAALIEIADQPPSYLQMEACAMCHDSIAAHKDEGPHAPLQCELCHGPGDKHIDDPEEIPMEISKSGSLCLRCHAMNAARSETLIKQIDPSDHAEGEECISCHNPHYPWL